MAKESKRAISNPHLKDSSSKLIFEDNILCSQFLRDYADMDILRNIQPEDLEDVTGRYTHFFNSERESDVVKKVDISKYLSVDKDENPLGLQLYFVSLIEHKSKVEYNVIMQILRYIVYIWEDYEKEMEKKYPYISARKDFRYPPVFPIVYYEGTGNWTASCDLSDRILCKELLNGYLPHFKYQVVRLRDYSNETLLNKGDEISLAMMINKISCLEDMEAFAQIPKERLDRIIKDTPDYLLGIMEKLMRALLYKMNLEDEKTEDAVSKIKERKMGRLFEEVTFDFQAARKELEEAAARAKEEAEVAKEEAEAAKEEAEAAKEEAEAIREEANREVEIARHVAGMLLNRWDEEEIIAALQQKFSLSEEQAKVKYAETTGNKNLT